MIGATKILRGQLSGKAGDETRGLRIIRPGAPFKDETPDEDDLEEGEGEEMK